MDKNTHGVRGEVKELSLEEIDILCRKCHHMHDEEILQILFRFFSQLRNIFSSEEKHPATLQLNND
jgi:hypothetical protein